MAIYFKFKGADGKWVGPQRMSSSNQKQHAINYTTYLLKLMHDIEGHKLVNAIQIAVDPHDLDRNYEEKLKANNYEVVNDKVRVNNTQGVSPQPPQPIGTMTKLTPQLIEVLRIEAENAISRGEQTEGDEMLAQCMKLGVDYLLEKIKQSPELLDLLALQAEEDGIAGHYIYAQLLRRLAQENND